MAIGKIKNTLQNQVRAFLFALGEFFRTPVTSLATILVIGIAISFPTDFYILLQNFEQVHQQWEQSLSISLYLQPGTDNSKVQTLMMSLKQNNSIADIHYISPDQGLKELSQQTELQPALNLLSENPLPGVIVITPSKQLQSVGKMEQLISELKQLPYIDNQHLDGLWVKRFYQWVLLGKRITYGLMAMFGLGVVLIVGNTIRITMQNYQQEIFVLKLVGATSSFIRRPLLYRGALYGLFGGIASLIFAGLFLKWLHKPSIALSLSYYSHWKLKFLDVQATLVIISTCTLLGLIGSWVCVEVYLRRDGAPSKIK